MISQELSKLDVCAGGHNMAGCTTFLYSLAKNISPLRTILEIGVNNGTSTSCFLLGLKDGNRKARLYSMDKKDVREKVGKFIGRDNFNKLATDWTFILGDSKEAQWEKEIDLLLIDGDHSYGGAKADYDKYVPFVRKGGIILMHDICRSAGAIRFWEELKVPKTTLRLSRFGMGIIEKW